MDSTNNHLQHFASWKPTDSQIREANIYRFMQEAGYDKLDEFYQWSIKQHQHFWQQVIDTLAIKFKQLPSEIYSQQGDVTSPIWLPGAKFNIVDSCLLANQKDTAIIEHLLDGQLKKYSYGELNDMTNRIANSLVKHGFKKGDPVAIIMPMNFVAVALYLGIIKMGGIVVSIADSFSSEEIHTRLNIANTLLVFTQDTITRGKKKHSLYQRVVEANPRQIIVIPEFESAQEILRSEDIAWDLFIEDNTEYESQALEAMDACNILFSSGTTSAPKAIVWNHSTAIKAASDGFFHQDIKPEDIFCWPTNLGWMMGPWLIFATLINRACIALYTQAPGDTQFGKFIQDAKVTILGVVPTMVAGWRESGCMQDLDWSHIKLFSSSGECSNPDDMAYLMSLANNKPIIEYCGGTEIGGAYITSTVLEENIPSQFTTPTMGMNFILINEEGKECDFGEVAIIPPSIGLSTKLLNADSYKVYFKDMPKGPHGEVLRRHGDLIQRLDNGHYIIQGRTDDTMNIGGIKISAVEIERALVGIPHLMESAAIAVPPTNGGPEQLIIFAVFGQKTNQDDAYQQIKKQVANKVNPLFKVAEVVILNQLPKTASNKIMRRVLRDGNYSHRSP